MEEIFLHGVRARVASTFFARAKGLIGVRELPPNVGLLILKCNCIHTFFMRFPIDALFLDRHNAIVKIVRNISPWRPFIWGGWRACKVLEIPSHPSSSKLAAKVISTDAQHRLRRKLAAKDLRRQLWP